MNQEEEAERIIEVFYNELTHGKEPPFWELKENAKDMAKQCALIHVNGIIEALDEYDNRTEKYLKEEFGLEYFSCELQNMESDWRYWMKVKSIIESK